jgi:hypothetical protein
MAFTPDMLAKLEAQRAHFASDEHIRERAALWRDATPAECLGAVAELCADAAAMIDRLEPEQQDRVLAPAPRSDEITRLLARLWQQR